MDSRIMLKSDAIVFVGVRSVPERHWRRLGVLRGGRRQEVGRGDLGLSGSPLVRLYGKEGETKANTQRRNGLGQASGGGKIDTRQRLRALQCIEWR